MASCKDYAKLKQVSAYFTEDILKNILHTVHNGTEVNVLGWDFCGTSSKGDNYLSTIYKIKVTGTVDGKQVQVNMVVKAIPKNVGRRNSFRSAEFFANEIAFYTKVIPKFEKFVKEKGQLQALCVPRHLASAMDDESGFVALEDASVLGFKSMQKQNSLDEEQCMILLKAMARFHAISFAYKDQTKDEFVEIAESLHETYYSSKHWSWYKRFHENIVDITKNSISTEYPGSEAEKKLNSYKASDLFQIACKLCDHIHHPTSVISQGDAWVPNYLFKESTENAAMMLDFQLARCASPILDVSTCIYACTEKPVWDKSFDTLLKSYYDELSNTIKLLGSNPQDVYSWDTFMNDVKEHFVFGMIFSMEIIPMILLDEAEIFDLDLIKDTNAIDIADVWTVSNFKTQSGRLKSANIVVHNVEKGYFELHK